MGRQKAVEEEKTTSSKPKIEDEAQAAASMRLAYQELSLDQKKTEDKIRTVDPKKANQVRYFPILLKSSNNLRRPRKNRRKYILDLTRGTSILGWRYL